MNKTEQAYAALLQCRKDAGEIHHWQFEAATASMAGFPAAAYQQQQQHVHQAFQLPAVLQHPAGDGLFAPQLEGRQAAQQQQPWASRFEPPAEINDAVSAPRIAERSPAWHNTWRGVGTHLVAVSPLPDSHACNPGYCV